MSLIPNTNIDATLNDFEQKINTLFVESMYLREVFNHKVNELKQKIDANMGKQCISDEDEEDEEEDKEEDEEDDDADDADEEDKNTDDNKQCLSAPFKPRVHKTRRPYTYNKSANAADATKFDKVYTPSVLTLDKAFQLSMQLDKPIMSDYWKASLNNSAFIGVATNGTKLLVKSADEYTSPISNIYKSENNLIVVTQNSIYIVDEKISKKRITQ